MKKLSIQCLIASLLIVNSASAISQDFTDTSGHWSMNYDAALLNQCNILGYLDQNQQPLSEFRPNESITRAELVKMIFQCSHVQLTGSSTLNDLPSTAWYTPYVQWAITKGFVQGYPDGSFRPNNLINRAEALKIILLAKFPTEQIVGNNSSFADVSSSDWYGKYVAYAISQNFISGYQDGLFHPSNNLTRGEAAKIISLVFGLISAPIPTPSSSVNGAGSVVGGCQIFPSDNPWNQDISNLPLHSNSTNFISSISSSGHLHPDFGSPAEYGIPFVIVDGNSTPKVQVNADYADESDFGLAPIPANAPIEGTSSSTGDRHVLVLDKAACLLYEMWDSHFDGQQWNVGSSAKFDLKSNALRPEGWTSADAAGLPVLPGLVRYDEVKSGTINHAIRLTVQRTQKGYIHPATHAASSSTDANLPPMGLRLRMKADFDLSNLTGDAKVIATAMKKYGFIIADNGSNWYFSGEANSHWDDDNLNQLKSIPGSAFEVVDTGNIIK